MINNFKNAQEAALFLERTRRSITGLCNKGEFPGARKEGLMWFIPEDALIAYKVKHPRKSNRSIKASQKAQDAEDTELLKQACAEAALSKMQSDEGGDV